MKNKHLLGQTINTCKYYHVSVVDVIQSSISCASAFSSTIGERRVSIMVAQVKGGSAFICHKLNTSEYSIG